MAEVLKYRHPERPPEEFYSIVDQVYQNEGFSPEEATKHQIRSLVDEQAPTHQIIYYWLPSKARLIGVFPQDLSQCHFAFWESIKDDSSNSLLFESFHHDARNFGYNKCSGPYHFNTFQRYRTRLKTPDWLMFNREPVNPSYYGALLEKAGYTADTRYESRLVRTDHVPDYYLTKQGFLDEVEKVPYRFYAVTEELWKERELEIFQLINAVFGSNPGFKPLEFEAYRKMYNPAYARRLCPHSSVIFEDETNGKLVSLCLCHPNYKSLNLDIEETPEFDVHYDLLSKKTLLVKTVGVHPDYRRQNLMTFMGAYAMLSFRSYYEECIFCLMRSDNFSLQFSEGLPYESCHYGLFSKDL